MPIYEYRCKACGYEFDRLQRASDPDPTCPNDVQAEDKPETERRVCGSEVKKLISQSSFALKGGGWADTGYT